MQFGLNEKIIHQLTTIFARYTNVSEVIIYGSRAKGNYTEGSDIDLALKGEGIDTLTLHKISDDIDEILLPWLIDLSIYHTIKNKELSDHIDRIGQIIYKKN